MASIIPSKDDSPQIPSPMPSSRLSEPLQNFLSSVGVVNTVDMDHDEGSPSASPSILESNLDLTPERLRFVFELFDTDQDDRLSYEALRKGLDFSAAGQCHTDDTSFQQLIDTLDVDKSGDISFEEFCQGMRLLMLRDLLRRNKKLEAKHGRKGAAAAALEVIDFDPVRLEKHIVSQNQTSYNNSSSMKTMELKDFYFNERPDWIKTRWINVVGGDEVSRNRTLQQLSILYSLHPLALEDALSPDVHRPKAESYSSHYFIMCPYFTLKWEEVPNPAFSQQSTSKRLACAIPNLVRWCLQGFPHRHTYTNHSGMKLDSSMRTISKLSKIEAHMASIFVADKDSVMITYIGKDVDDISDGDTTSNSTPPLGHRARQDLELSYSKLRQYDAQYLVYALLDEAVDALEPLIARLQRELDDELHLLHANHFASLERMHTLQREINKVSQKLKPFLRLLTHVIEDDKISPGATIYLRDVLDNLEGYDEDVRQLLLNCQAVDDEADKFQQQQMDQTLYTLTIISAVFLPAQFLTGVWGMNFEEMPELGYDHGYAMFWGLAAALILLMLCLLNFGRLRR